MDAPEKQKRVPVAIERAALEEARRFASNLLYLHKQVTLKRMTSTEAKTQFKLFLDAERASLPATERDVLLRAGEVFNNPDHRSLIAEFAELIPEKKQSKEMRVFVRAVELLREAKKKGDRSLFVPKVHLGQRARRIINKQKKVRL